MSESEPLGAVLQRLESGYHFTLLSRGDRVHGRVNAPLGPGPWPLILIAAPDGEADGAGARAAREAWCEWAVTAALDLPLCGARRSDKLSLEAFGARGELVERLAPDLELQIHSDLERCLRFLGGVLPVDTSRTALACAGEAGALALGFCARADQVRALALPRVEAAEAVAASAGEGRATLLDGGPPDAEWIAAAGAFLAERLAP